MESKNPIYPELSAKKIQNPSKMWAFPIFGGLVKIIILVPVFIEIGVLFLYVFILQVINSFYVLFNKKYWEYCFKTTVGTLNLLAKTEFFFSGLSNKYPGFNLGLNGDFDLKFTMPKTPNVWFAFPIFGGVVRAILLIPFAIFSQVISNGANVGVVASSIPVFFKGTYPDSTFEFLLDSIRLNLSQTAYFAGISDKYPSFKINMDHQLIKIVLIIIGTLLLFQAKFDNQTDRKIESPRDFAPSYQNYR